MKSNVANVNAKLHVEQIVIGKLRKQIETTKMMADSHVNMLRQKEAMEVDKLIADCVDYAKKYYSKKKSIISTMYYVNADDIELEYYPKADEIVTN